MARSLLVVSLFACLSLALGGPQIDGRIAGGYEASSPNQFPYQAAIYIQPSEIVEPLAADFCSGSLISENYVLTAARCLANAESVTVVLGGIRLDVLEPSQIQIHSKDFIIPENYEAGKYEWDVALIKLSTPVEFAKNIQPVKLADNDDDYVGDAATVTGWGATYQAQQTVESVLRWLKSVVSSYRQCVRDNSPYKPIVVEGVHLCQYADNNVGSACRGDIGAPLVVDDGVQIGIAEIVPLNCFREIPVIYTRVGNYIDWIKENAQL